MTTLTTAESDDGNRNAVSLSNPPTEGKPALSSVPNQISASPVKRIPSSPYKPFTSGNFFDLTRSVTSSPGGTPKSIVTVDSDITEIERPIPNFKQLQQNPRENVFPKPMSRFQDIGFQPRQELAPLNPGSLHGGVKKDPSTLLPPNSSLWRESKADVRKIGMKQNMSPSIGDSGLQRTYESRDMDHSQLTVPSRSKATAISMPVGPPRPTPYVPHWSSAFIHPESIQEPVPEAMSQQEADEALKNFFENALDAEKDDEDKHAVEEEGEGMIEGLKVTLMKHQIEGLKFLQDHELPRNLPTKSKGKGKGTYGGILADDMGLGKTIQSLALILTRPRHEPDGKTLARSSSKCCKGTLLVVPLALADQWRREVLEKTTLSVYVHHGPKRTSDPTQLARYDVVITTYDTVSSEWSQIEKPDPDDLFNNGRGVFRVGWWRVILDEAHTIKNHKAKMSKACCALTAEYRWCLTGTPYQNNVDDIYSLIKFLRIPPFEEWSYWRERITKPSKNDQMRLALTRLRTLLRALMLRRTKDVLKGHGVMLPAKEVITEDLEFDQTERNFYDDLCARGQQVIEELQNRKGGLRKHFMCLLTMLLRLRQATDHIDLLKGKIEDDKDALNDNATPVEANRVPVGIDNDLVDMMKGLGIETKCVICFTVIPNGQERCGACDTNLRAFKAQKDECERPSSSKIRRMLEILKTKVDDMEVKTIVFSQFTSMLDLIEPFLRDHKIEYGRYDGKMRKDRRDAMLNAFRTTRMPVLLVSLKSGSVGLNLNSASRVIMLDMWWNPAIEEQAIDRVHRIGQTRRVVVHKLMIKNSVDERILKLQKDKKEQANGALGDGVIRRKGQNANKLTMQDVWYLFNMPAEQLDRF